MSACSRSCSPLFHLIPLHCLLVYTDFHLVWLALNTHLISQSALFHICICGTHILSHSHSLLISGRLQHMYRSHPANLSQAQLLKKPTRTVRKLRNVQERCVYSRSFPRLVSRNTVMISELSSDFHSVATYPNKLPPTHPTSFGATSSNPSASVIHLMMHTCSKPTFRPLRAELIILSIARLTNNQSM
jgi:hypothetical protein